MPEYSHIQTYVKCNGNNFEFEINHFTEVLSLIGIKNEETISYFKSLNWEIDDNGFMYVGGSAETQELLIDGVNLHIRPFIMGWTPEVINELSEPWLELCLLLWTEEIEHDSQLKDKCKPVIWKLMNQFADNYYQTGVFFTSEISDGRAWEGIISNDTNYMWDFYAAIIPESLIHKYRNRNTEYFYQSLGEERLNIVKKDVWAKKPW